jgi:hypothetical protein
LVVKAILFIVLGAFAGALLVAQSPRVYTVALLFTCVWAFARAYYFAFYVIQHYIDSSFRFSGLVTMIKYLRAASKNSAD